MGIRSSYHTNQPNLLLLSTNLKQKIHIDQKKRNYLQLLTF